MKRKRDVDEGEDDDKATDSGGDEPAAEKGDQLDNVDRARQFTDAMDRRDDSLVMELLEQGIDEATLNRARGFWNITPLHWACKRGLVEIASLMIDKGARLETGNLSEAYYSGCFPMMKALIDRGVNIKESPVLHYACDDDRPDVIKFLLENGFDMQAQDERGRTPLQCTWWKKNLDTIKFFIENGVDHLNTTNDYRGTAPIHDACSWGLLEIVKLLIEKGADVNLRSRKGDMPLNIACEEGDLEVAKLLIAHGANAHDEDGLGNTPLHSACAGMSSRFEFIKFLLIEDGSKVNAKSNNGFTPLHCACEGQKSLGTIELLIKFGADLFATDEDGKTPLHVACRDGDVPLEIIQSLIEHGSDVNAKDNNGVTPLHLACEQGHLKLVKLLLGFLIDNNSNLDVQDNNGTTPLHKACDCHNPSETFKLLIESGVNLNAADNNGRTPLYLACKCGDLNGVKCLLSRGANVDVRTTEGSTLIHAASERKHNLELVWYLVRNYPLLHR